MPDLDDIDLDLDIGGDRGDFSLRRVLVGIARVIWWLVWDVGCEWVAWSLGWVVCRVLTVGRFPAVGWDQEGEAEWWEALLVILVGLLVLGGLAWAVIEAVG